MSLLSKISWVPEIPFPCPPRRMARKIAIALVNGVVAAFAELSISCGECRPAPRGRNCTSTLGSRFSCSVWCIPARDHHSEIDGWPDPWSDQFREKLWEEFLSDPCQWSDHRSHKDNPKCPDFKHKKTQQGLWIMDNLNPPWVKAGLATERHVLGDPRSDQIIMRERLWREFFSDPSQWWDNRSEKVNPRYPDFKHKKTGQSLWLDNRLTPPWVKTELAILPPSLLHSNSFSWNLRLRRHVEVEDYKMTLNIFHEMQREGMVPDKFTFVPVLNACASLKSLDEGRRVHEQIIQRGCESEIYVANCLIDMYAKCGSIEDACSVFNRMPKRSVVSWTAMIGAYVKAEEGLKALALFRNMCQQGVEPNTVTFVGVLNACASLADLEEGRRVHKQIIQRGCEFDVYVANCLVDMYAKCRSIGDAWSVFNKMRGRDVVTWNAMIGGYVKAEQGLKALELFQKMQQEGVGPNTITFIIALNACASLSALDEGRRVHKQIIGRSFESDVYVANCLVDMYAKCGSIEDAWNFFIRMPKRSVVSWNVMIGGCVKSEQRLKALELFRKMQEEEVEPDTVTFVVVLNACARAAALEEGRSVHGQIIERGCESDICIANCLIDMYAKCGSIGDAWSVFNGMREHDMVSWSAMIAGYVMSEQGLKALELFRNMQQDGVEPDTVNFVGALNACACVAALKEGRRVHKQIIRRGYQSNVYVANCLVDMYSKCGSIKDARSVFNKLQERDVVSWNAMIAGYAMHGLSKKAIELFELMHKEDIEIDDITFTCLLSACSHGGLVKEGLHYFKTMTSHYNIHATREHYACMVDLLGRAGQLEEAEAMAKSSAEKDSCLWMSLLGACRIYGNIEMAERAAKQCWELDPENASAHMLLWNIHAAAGKWDRCAAIEEESLKRKVWKKLGHTWIKVNNVMHLFVVGEDEHPQLLQIHAELERLSVHMDEEGYIPHTRFL